MKQTGSGTVKDVPSAIELYELSCGGSDGHGCNNLGAVYESGLAGPADPDRARLLYERACKLGDDAGCKNLARQRGASPPSP